MPISGRAVAIAWVVWTILLCSYAWWEWRQLAAGSTIGVAIEIGSPVAILGRLALLYSPVLLLTVAWLWRRLGRR